jgi:site-specific DNA-methyltransferase (adenine-specific)
MRGATILRGDCRELLRDMPDNSLDSVVTDPPYHLTAGKKGGTGKASEHKDGSPFATVSRLNSSGFMGQAWDGGDTAFQVGLWTEILRVLKPGGHVAAFGGSRTYHRLACAIEDAGFEVRDMVAWTYGSGFPKSHDISKAIDKTAGAEREVVGRYRPPNGTDWNLANDKARTEVGAVGHSSRADSLDRTAPATDAAREWEGWGTALKPSLEPICLARKPLSEKSIAANVLKWGTGALNIDGCRIETDEYFGGGAQMASSGTTVGKFPDYEPAPNVAGSPLGRWPANLCHDGSDEAVAGFPAEAGAAAPVHKRNGDKFRNAYGAFAGNIDEEGSTFRGDSGSAARFFYCAKAGKLDRLGSSHPTVKPVALMRWLCRLVTPPGGLVLDPFAGTGSTGIAAYIEGFRSTLMELRDEAADDIERRLKHIQGIGRTTAIELAQRELADPEKVRQAGGHDLPLFDTGAGAS